MDAIAASNQSGFMHLISHISLFHKPMSPGYESLVSSVLTNDVKLRGAEQKGKFKLWDVPGMGTQLGKVMPFDIYGQHVLIDETELRVPAKKITHGVLRYAVAAAGVRRKEGGRRVYDYATMNFALASGAILGGAFLFHSRRRFNWLNMRPGFSLLLALGVCAATVPVVRSLFKIFAVGITIAERQHAKALKVTECYDCLSDIYEFTEEQIADAKLARLPPPKPGLPPVTPQQEKAFASAMEMQALVLGRDLSAIRSILKDMLRRSGQLILSPEHNTDGNGGGDHDQSPEAKPTKKQLKAEYETNLTSAEERALLINSRRVPACLLCDVHKGLRVEPDTYTHPLEYPIYPLDRELAKKRLPMIVEN